MLQHYNTKHIIDLHTLGKTVRAISKQIQVARSVVRLGFGNEPKTIIHDLFFPILINISIYHGIYFDHDASLKTMMTKV